MVIHTKQRKGHLMNVIPDSGRRITAAAMAMLCVTALLHAEPAARSAEEIKKDIEAARAKVESLEREAQAAEQREQAQREVTEMAEQAAQRVSDLQSELKDLSAPAEEGITPARKAQREARLKCVKALLEVNTKIAALKSHTQRQRAAELLQDRDIVEFRWNNLTNDYHQHAIEIEEGHHIAAERGKGQEILIEAQKLLDQDLKDGEAFVALYEKRVKADNAFHALREKFDKLME
jgi:hypothetical protein